MRTRSAIGRCMYGWSSWILLGVGCAASGNRESSPVRREIAPPTVHEDAPMLPHDRPSAAPVAATPNAYELFAAAKQAPLGEVDISGPRARDPSVEPLRALCARVVADARGKLGCAACPEYTALALDRAANDAANATGGSAGASPADSQPSLAYALNERVLGSFTRAGAKQVLLHLEGCSLLFGSDLVLLEHTDTRWVLLRYVPLIQTAAIPGTRTRRSRDGRDIVVFQRAVQSMPGGLATLTACEFGEEGDRCWPLVTTHDIGRCVDPAPLESSHVSAFALGDWNRDGRPDVSVDIDTAQIAAFTGPSENFDEACRKRSESHRHRRLSYVRREDDFVLMQTSAKREDDEEVIAPSAMDSLL